MTARVSGHEAQIRIRTGAARRLPGARSPACTPTMASMGSAPAVGSASSPPAARTCQPGATQSGCSPLSADFDRKSRRNLVIPADRSLVRPDDGHGVTTAILRHDDYPFARIEILTNQEPIKP